MLLLFCTSDIYVMSVFDLIWPPFLKKTTTTPVCHSKGIVPDVRAMLQRSVNHDSPTTSRAFRSLGRISYTIRLLQMQRCLTAPETSTPVMKEPSPKSFRLCLQFGMHVGGIEKNLKVFLPAPKYGLS